MSKLWMWVFILAGPMACFGLAEVNPCSASRCCEKNGLRMALLLVATGPSDIPAARQELHVRIFLENIGEQEIRVPLPSIAPSEMNGVAWIYIPPYETAFDGRVLVPSNAAMPSAKLKPGQVTQLANVSLGISAEGFDKSKYAKLSPLFVFEVPDELGAEIDCWSGRIECEVDLSEMLGAIRS